MELLKKEGLEIETFIHGAMCYCYSGQCLLSSMIGGRSGNRGKSFEVRNLTFTKYPEDAIGMEGEQEGGVLTSPVSRLLKLSGRPSF